MHEVTATLARRREVAREMFVLSFTAPQVAAEVQAGQFVNLLLRPGAFLRRPFSVYRTDGDTVEVVLRPVGEGTRELCGLQVGDRVSLLGPLGRGFDLDGATHVTLLSGGLGVAPMPLAARAARARGLPVNWVHGAATAADLCREWDADAVYWATDDGSRGRHGTALDALPADPGLVLACGPNGMLAGLAARHPHAQVAVETYMGCGTGVCLGCAVPRASGGFDRACVEGPVYEAASVRWEELPRTLHYEVAS